MRVWYAEPLGHEQYIAWWILHLVFGFTYWNQVRALPVRTSLAHRLLIVAVLTVSALGVSVTAETSLGGILLLIVAGLLPWILSLAAAIAWLVGQNVLLVLVIDNIPEIALSDALLTGGLFLGMSLFAFMTGIVALGQHAARDELRKVNSELRATQALLADNTRIAERVRIARELHDLVGHHLTALTLNLEVATHLVEGKALEHVQQAHSLAKLLLADVREVVSEMREDDTVDLAAALRTLAGGTPEPRITRPAVRARARRPAACPGAVAVHPGNDHQQRAPRAGGKPVDSPGAGRARPRPDRSRRRPRRSPVSAGQRPQRHDRAAAPTGR
jgi:signal transduction histidine kinase